MGILTHILTLEFRAYCLRHNSVSHPHYARLQDLELFRKLELHLVPPSDFFLKMPVSSVTSCVTSAWHTSLSLHQFLLQ